MVRTTVALRKEVVRGDREGVQGQCGNETSRSMARKPVNFFPKR